MKKIGKICEICGKPVHDTGYVKIGDKYYHRKCYQNLKKKENENNSKK